MTVSRLFRLLTSPSKSSKMVMKMSTFLVTTRMEIQLTSYSYKTTIKIYKSLTHVRKMILASSQSHSTKKKTETIYNVSEVESSLSTIFKVKPGKIMKLNSRFKKK